MPTDGPAFRDERKLSKDEIATLAAWVDAGAPEGDSRDAPPPREFTGGWAKGEPDLIVTPREVFHLGASGKDTFRCFVVPLELTDNKWVVGFDVRPGDARVVHHTLHFFDGSGTARKLEEAERRKKLPSDALDRGAGYPVTMGVGFPPPPHQVGELPQFGTLGGWAPGQAAQMLPEGTGMFLPRGSDFVLQVHYHRVGKPAEDRTLVGLYFAKKPVEQPMQTIAVQGLHPEDLIKPGDKNYQSGGAVKLTEDAVLHNVMVHMHLLGKSARVTLKPPRGEPRTLLEIKHWDYRWQDTYWFKDPILAPAGSIIEAEGTYDNSADNPNNPSSPPKPVKLGDETTSEMLFVFLGATSTKKPWELLAYEPVAREEPKEPEKGAEMKVLERLVGRWEWERTVKKPKESTTRGEYTVTKELGGKVIQIKSKWDKGESLMLATWKALPPGYSASYYDSEGDTCASSGKYDPKANTLTWTNYRGLSFPDPTTTTEWKFIDDDTFECHTFKRGDLGSLVLDVTTKVKRKK